MIRSFLKRKDVYLPALVVFFLGASLRFYSFYFSSLLFNIDGILYLQQAKALYLGAFDRYTACYAYPNLYTVIIVPFYWLMGHWVIAAKTASFIFGTATLIPLYFTLRYFLNRQISTAVLLLVAVNPFLVKTSSEVLRGPMFWFFVSLGLYLFTSGFVKQRRLLWLSGSCVAYLIAFGARVDALAFLLVTPVFIICMGERGRKMRDLLGFLAPLLLFGGVGGVILVVAQVSLHDIFPRDIVGGLQRSFDSYGHIREGLRELGSGGDHAKVSGIPIGFFNQCRNLLVWIALADTFWLLVGMSFYPFFLFFIFGFKGVWSKLRADVKLRYLLMLGMSGFGLVMLQEISSWFMSARFIILCYLPILVFFGFGLERFVVFLENKKGWGRVAILLCLCGLCFFVTLPKNLQHNRADKAIFREMGEYIAEREGAENEIHVGAFFKRVGYTNVFANLEVQTAPCMKKYWLPSTVHGATLLQKLQKRDVDYFIWDEKSCSLNELEVLRHGDAVEVTSWQTKRLGKLFLFELEPNNL